MNNARYDTSGIYTQTILNSQGCDSIITLNLTVNRFFKIRDTAICYGQSYFTGGSSQIVSGVYTDTLQTPAGCDLVTGTNLIVHPKLSLDLGNNSNLCQGQTVILNAGLFSNYQWQDGSTQSAFTINNTGSYWVKVEDEKSCTAIDSITFLKWDTLPKHFLPKDLKLCPNDKITITIPGYTNYLWGNGSTLNNILLEAGGKYYLTATDSNNCTGKDTLSVELLEFCVPISFPNAFSPDNNGLNDVFKPLVTQQTATFHLVIYNRLGQKIFETKNERSGWNGTFKGKLQPAGTYVFQSSFKTIGGRVFNKTGSFVLIR